MISERVCMCVFVWVCVSVITSQSGRELRTTLGGYMYDGEKKK